jgi:AhpD family alkylhydroperoxidase
MRIRSRIVAEERSGRLDGRVVLITGAESGIGRSTASTRAEPPADPPSYDRYVARIDIPHGPGGDAAMVWSLRPEMGAMVEQMITTVYRRSVLPANEREVARMRIAQLNACGACSTFRAPSVVAAGVTEDLYEHVHEAATYPGYSERQRLAVEYAERYATDHRGIDDELFDRLRSAFTDPELLDLTMCVAVYLGLGRALEVLGIDDSCAIDI